MNVKKAEDFAKEQKEISVSEFFEKNKHLLGFDNPTKSLLMAVKEAVDNSLDASEEAGIMPDIAVKIKAKDENTYIVSVTDNGPGIVRENVPRVFGKLLYGSKFHRLKQSLTGDEPIIIEAGGKCQITPIGKFVDKFLDSEGEIDVSGLKISVPCFDWKRHRYAFRTVSHLIKHKRRNEIIRIRTRYGKEIKVTGCHSLFTLDKEAMEIKEAAARSLEPGDLILVPKKLPEPTVIQNICLLDYIDGKTARKNWWYLYLPREAVNAIFLKASIIHKKMPGDKSRRYYRFDQNGENIDILDDSYKQYSSKGFIPVWLAKSLMENGVMKKDLIEGGVIRSYYHGKNYDIAAMWPLTPILMKFLGLFVAEGHTDKRHVGITVNVSENNLIKTATDFAVHYGINAAIEKRERNAMRVNLFGGVLSTVLREWCGRGAKNKRIPSFVFNANPELRQHFIDYLYLGDGHNTKERNQLMHFTVSERLSRELSYLWLLQGVQASVSKRKNTGYGSSISFVTTVFGRDIKKSLAFRPGNENARTAMRKHSYLLDPHFWAQRHGLGYMTENNGTFVLTKNGGKMAQIIKNLTKFQESDLTALEILEKETIDSGHEYVYDISVPEGENFVGGSGGVACHNSRGQQGIGISSVTLYAQLTTGVPTKVWSKIESKKKTYYCELHLNTAKNEPDIIKEEEIDKDILGEHGIRVEMEIHGRYRKTVEDYLKQTSISNPFAKIAYTAPDGTKTIFPRSLNELPKPSKIMKPHPHGMEFGILQRLLQNTSSRTLQSFLTNEFSSVGQQSAKEICKLAKLAEDSKPNELDRAAIEKLIKGMQTAKIQRPPTDCLSPIGSAELEKSLKKEYPNAEFVTSITRDPEVYRGFPFLVEVGIIYGFAEEGTPSRKKKEDDEDRKEDTIELIRFANRVPLLYQQSACALTEAVKDVDWRRYNLQQSGNNLPSGPMKLVVHICSVWVPFMSESKEAVAAYPEIIKEAKLAIQDAGRKLSSYLSGKRRAGEQHRRMQMFDRYAGEVSDALAILTGKNGKEIEKKLKVLVESRVHIKEEFVDESTEAKKEVKVEKK